MVKQHSEWSDGPNVLPFQPRRLMIASAAAGCKCLLGGVTRGGVANRLDGRRVADWSCDGSDTCSMGDAV